MSLEKTMQENVRSFMRKNPDNKGVKAINYSSEETLCEADYEYVKSIVVITAVRPLMSRADRNLDSFLFFKKRLFKGDKNLERFRMDNVRCQYKIISIAESEDDIKKYHGTIETMNGSLTLYWDKETGKSSLTSNTDLVPIDE